MSLVLTQTPWAHSSSVLKSGPPDGHRVTRRGTHGPVVVDVTQLVRQPLDVVRLQAAAVIDDVVMCGRHTAASHRLAHDKKVVPGITDTHKPRGRSGFPLRTLEGRGFTFPTARRPCTTTSAGPAGRLCLCVCVSVCAPRLDQLLLAPRGGARHMLAGHTSVYSASMSTPWGGGQWGREAQLQARSPQMPLNHGSSPASCSHCC